MQTVSQRLKLDRVDIWLLSINVLLVLAFNLNLYFLFVSDETQWLIVFWCLAGLLVFWILLWSLVPRRTIQKNNIEPAAPVSGSLLSLITIYSLLNGLSYLWIPGLDGYLTVFLQCGLTLIVGITMTLALVDQCLAGFRLNGPVVIFSYCVVLMTFVLNLAGLWLMLTGGV
ncbi:MAG: hypothetical protein CME33_17795 [Gimesia sp.]|uniref:hypothetical protein n=1 Tax=Gimesia sp. TaxID=2024833 RepID=UPI000C5DC6DD|nr:hypothetical protein [Gimesia sp.]MAX38410.1 hypothetical protein [Gimesia sp.]|tara:strand:- start:1577 stop:2089 length:513 start_codon:yes stop_codon:yes gene_type:complete